MKTLVFQRNNKNNRVTVACHQGDISVHSYCAYCRHCKGVVVGTRVAPSPQSRALIDIRKGATSDDTLMDAAMMFNSLIRDGTAIACDDDGNSGYSALY